VYCAGLFDYLSDRTCKRLMQHFYNLATPGGLVVSTNVHKNNPVRYFMEHIMEWHLIYRDEAKMQALAPDGKVRLDVTGINVFLEVRKPEA
jgi:extracellular factor (EF) 3-hydroxypalmitic acid methyl ester biosynthesis protein